MDSKPGVTTTAVGAPGLLILTLADLEEASANVADVNWVYPTAVHNVGDMHDTADKLADPAVGSGVASSAHVSPFHTSASVMTKKPAFENPTAVHTVGDVHDTPSKMLRFGFGVGWIVHACPSQASVSDSTVTNEGVNE